MYFFQTVQTGFMFNGCREHSTILLYTKDPSGGGHTNEIVYEDYAHTTMDVKIFIGVSHFLHVGYTFCI